MVMESIDLPYEMVPIGAVRPPAGYIGGKRALSQQLVKLIDARPHARYCEPFVGMGGVFFRRRWRPKAEFINDISEDVTTLFRVLQRLYQPFIDMLRWRFASRAEFERLMRVDPSTLLDVERAARFLYLQRNAFGGKVVGRNFGVSYDTPSKFRLSAIEALLQDVHDRLEPVYIERLGYADFIRKYDRPVTLFYVDPPYAGNEADYGPGVFSEADFEVLSDLLGAAKGRFIMSINDTPAIRAIFAGCDIQPVNLNYRVSGQVTPARELIITGGDGN